MYGKLTQSLHHLTTSEERELFDFGSKEERLAPSSRFKVSDLF